MLQLLKNLLPNRLREQGISEAVEAAQVMEVFKDEVAKIYGASARNDFRRLVLEGNTIEVSAYSSAFASELRMRQLELEEAIKVRLGGKQYRLRIFA